MKLKAIVRSMRILLAAWLAEIPDLARQALFHPRCRICDQPLVGRGERAVCADCLARVRIDNRSCCPRCGLWRESGDACGACRLDPPPFLRHRSYGAYEGTLRQLIVLYKYGEIEVLGEPLAACLEERLNGEAYGEIDLVVPVPGDPRRHREFHPAAELARRLARRRGLPFCPGLLRKVRTTPAQAGLNRERRLTNLRGAFAAARPAELRRKRVLLVDDVFTTGATLRACARALTRAGARVFALTVAQSVWQLEAAPEPENPPKSNSGD